MASRILKQVLRKIRLRPQCDGTAGSIVDAHKVENLTGRVLAARGFEPGGALSSFLNPTLREGLPEPDRLKNLLPAADRISAAALRGGKIAICCDFDVDGLTGGAQLFHFLKSNDIACEIFVPDRFEDGYGLNEKIVQSAHDCGCTLLVTIDFGTTNVKELELARRLGLETIVLDHHHVAHEPPPADVFINPNQTGCGFAGKSMCASGLTWYLLLALRSHIGKNLSRDIRSYLELACLGTICDMVPLIDVNRVIARRGLERIATSEWPGIVALKRIAGLKAKVGCSDISFALGPRLNAAGRLVHGKMVIELLTSSDIAKAEKIAQQLDSLNKERQEAEQIVKEHALECLEARGTLPSGIAVWNKSYHTGVIGIVAQRLTEHFYRPAAVMGQDEKGIFKGSVRGIKGFSVVDALSALSKYLIKFGGHEGAGGFSVREKDIESFGRAFDEICAERLKSLETSPIAEVDTEALLSELTPRVVEEFSTLSPFGVGNPQPTILLRNLSVIETRVLKDSHLRTTLSDGNKMITGLFWRHTSHPAIRTGCKVSIACKPEASTYQGFLEIQANIVAAEAA